LFYNLYLQVYFYFSVGEDEKNLTLVFGRWYRFFEWMWSAAARGEDVEWGSDEWRGIG